jgi:hypothetical protein
MFIMIVLMLMSNHMHGCIIICYIGVDTSCTGFIMLVFITASKKVNNHIELTIRVIMRKQYVDVS